MFSWADYELEIFKKLKTPDLIQNYLDKMDYNSSDDCLSPRYVLLSKDCHCFEGALLAAAILESHGHPPLLVDFKALEFDDPHVICVYKYKSHWGSIGKSSTSLLAGRSPVYKTIRELALSYFDFYFDKKGRKSLLAYSNPINLNNYNKLGWRTTEENLLQMGISLNRYPHKNFIPASILRKLSSANPRLIKSCFS